MVKLIKKLGIKLLTLLSLNNCINNGLWLCKIMEKYCKSYGRVFEDYLIK